MNKLNLPKINVDIAKHWEKNNTFKKSLDLSKDKPEFIFYDGPPFATGLPHYGHLLASTIKDIIPRYKTQTGYYVDRVWGFDCHGLPIEYEIEKQLGIKTKQQIIDYTIPLYNEKCRSIVLKYADEWEKTIELLGRWVDYKNQWKTMDVSYMESVWWVFKQLYEKGFIYRGFKVMPYSTGCHTPLSNFEAQSNYKEVKDYSLTVKFDLTSPSLELLRNKLSIEIKNVSILVWTTTPWTLPSNLAICLSPKLKYVLIMAETLIEVAETSIKVSDKQYYILAKNCLSKYFLEENKYVIISEVTNDLLKNMKYVPLFPYYSEKYPHAFNLLFDNYVSDDKGTGCVHQAPSFGQDDYRVCAENNLIVKGEQPPCPINSDGCFTDPVEEYKNLYIKDAEVKIIIDLKKRNMVFKSCKESHDYPHCWRSETPLIYMTVSSWFMEVEKITDKLVDCNKKIKWSPQNIGSNRFGNWLESANDWCISRNRYWGTPMPIWSNGIETIVIGSIAELEKLAGLKSGSITDLHTHFIDEILIPSTLGNAHLKRIPEVFDCWFESGSMPYAYSNNSKVNKFPADFIAEGLDQTRGWFYALHVISTALFNQPAFKNVIVNGLILAEDGKKMSKSLKNYPDPHKMFDIYGADALRLYLINSDVVQAEPMRFSEKDIKRLVQIFFIPYHNSVSFLVELMKYYFLMNNKPFIPNPNLNEMKLDKLDYLMLMSIDKLIKNIHNDMNKYQLRYITDKFISVIDKISRMYIKLKKLEIKKIQTIEAYNSLNILYYTLYTLTLMLSPFAPFISEYYYLELTDNKQSESVHFLQLPQSLTDIVTIDVPSINDVDLIEGSEYFLKLLDMGHVMRNKLPFSYKRPLKSLTIVHNDEKVHKLIKVYNDYLLNDLNVLEILYEFNDDKYVDWQVSLNSKKLAQSGFKEHIKDITDYLKSNQTLIYQSLMTTKQILFKGITFSIDFFKIEKVVKDENKNASNIAISSEFSMIGNIEFDEQIEYLYELRQLIRAINDYRKANYLTISDLATAQCHILSTNDKFSLFFDKLVEDLYPKTKIKLYMTDKDFDGGQTFETYDAKIKIKLN